MEVTSTKWVLDEVVKAFDSKNWKTRQNFNQTPTVWSRVEMWQETKKAAVKGRRAVREKLLKYKIQFTRDLLPLLALFPALLLELSSRRRWRPKASFPAPLVIINDLRSKKGLGKEHSRQQWARFKLETFYCACKDRACSMKLGKWVGMVLEKTAAMQSKLRTRIIPNRLQN